ncbi:MAG: glycosyltransferase, partial [Parafilimonas sp.]
AHELFTEQKEIVSRPMIHKLWLFIEKFAVPKFKYGYTVSPFISKELKRRYKVNYEVIRNLPNYYSFSASAPEERMDKFLIYQGAVNEGRSFETLIPAMQNVNSKLRIYGSGNFIEQTKNLIIANNVQNKVELMGYVLPEKLKEITTDSYIGLMLFEKTGLNQYYSLSNRFFDYIMAAIPQLCVNYPEYKTVNDKFNIAYMIEDTDAETITQALNKLLNDAKLYQQLHQNCLKAREELNWEKEQNKLIKFYEEIATSIMHYRVIKIRKKNFK